MKEYEVKFEIYGKKMKTKIEATSEEMAERILRHKIKIHSVTDLGEKGYKENPLRDRNTNDIFDNFSKIFGDK